MIEDRVALLARVRKVALDKYLSVEDVALLLRIPVEEVPLAIHSNKTLVSVIMPDNSILVHPDTVFLAVKLKMRYMLTRSKRLARKKMGIS